jgi:CubicO group peptidase (beta-lactamase class C family)
MMIDDRHEWDRRRPSRGAKLASSAAARFRDLRGPAAVAIVTAFVALSAGGGRLGGVGRVLPRVALAAGGAGPEAPSSLSATHPSAPSGSAAAGVQANAAVDAIFAAWDRPDSPGCALGVVQAGELTYERGYGMANLDWGIPIATDTVFYVGSVSKQFTAAAVALLALDGRIGLDDDIREYFPEMPVYERPITIRQLVHHTSGIRDIYTLMALAGIRLEDVFPDEEAIALIARQRQTNFPTGDEHLYSNSGYFLLAQLIERVSGQSLREFAASRIFEPLGMTSTHFHDIPDHVVKRRAMSYTGGPAGPGRGSDRDGEFRVSYLGNFDKVGAGGLYTTVQDLLLWDRNFYTGDVGGQPLLDLIHTPGVLEDGEPITYAFGLTVDEYRGVKSVSHSGSMMGFKAAFLQLPGERFSVLVACNLGSIEPMGLARRVADIYLDGRLAPVEPPPPVSGEGRAGGPGAFGGERPSVSLTAAELEAFAGTYYSAELDAVYDLSVADGNLIVGLRNTPDMRLQPLGDDAFRGRWTFRFERDSTGEVTAFTVDAGRVTNIRFNRR